MKFASCHPDREHAGMGLCNACYCRHRYARNLEFRAKARQKRVRYYAAHREQERVRASTRYEANRVEIIRKQCEYQRRPEVVERRRARRIANCKLQIANCRKRKRIDKPNAEPRRSHVVATLMDRNWWRPRSDEIPRRWLLEAAA